MTRRRLVVIALACLAILAGCGGVSAESTPRVINPTLVPNQLLDTKAPRPSDQPTGTGGTGGTMVTYFVSAGRIVPVRRPELEGTTGERLRRSIGLLLEGPTEKEQASGLGTAVPIDLDLSVTSVRGSTVTIEVAGTARNSRSEDRTLAVAQIVLTTTSVNGIDAVQLTQEGKTIEAPLVDGSLSAAPLTASDYAALLAATTTWPTRTR
ncbi:GerMN domain-containing protein [Tenggerimyces flavus]|uniref:GerMN domain-containing protein n=1 Tax=Tenggerimyces flavus TaxID=1708749 RepID=A0ABV7YDX3_9ACTN|nr:GerMN domain-containing protein [Tenggerimyces flavus]MBM7788151.1 spore germination protein GerM [Tenggerimyces flavus]